MLRVDGLHAHLTAISASNGARGGRIYKGFRLILSDVPLAIAHEHWHDEGFHFGPCGAAISARNQLTRIFPASTRKRGAKMRSIRLRWFAARFLVFLGVTALALSLTAAASADTTTKHVTFDHDVVIGGTKLAAGDYILIIANGHLTVKLERKIVAQATTHWEARDNTPDRDSVLFGDNNQVLEIRFAHERAVLVLAAP